MPAKLRPYLHLIRADKQVGTLLLLWPCWWSIALAAPMGQLPDLVILSKFSLGALLMRSAGCIINDMWDRDFDKHVERTKTRPLASGELVRYHVYSVFTIISTHNCFDRNLFVESFSSVCGFVRDFVLFTGHFIDIEQQ
jgi:4-hydroxybenzoate polyprenyltransferase